MPERPRTADPVHHAQRRHHQRQRQHHSHSQLGGGTSISRFLLHCGGRGHDGELFSTSCSRCRNCSRHASSGSCTRTSPWQVQPVYVCASDFGWVSRPRLWWTSIDWKLNATEPEDGKYLQWTKAGRWDRPRLETTRRSADDFDVQAGDANSYHASSGRHGRPAPKTSRDKTSADADARWLRTNASLHHGITNVRLCSRITRSQGATAPHLQGLHGRHQLGRQDAPPAAGERMALGRSLTPPSHFGCGDVQHPCDGNNVSGTNDWDSPWICQHVGPTGGLMGPPDRRGYECPLLNQAHTGKTVRILSGSRCLSHAYHTQSWVQDVGRIRKAFGDSGLFRWL